MKRKTAFSFFELSIVILLISIIIVGVTKGSLLVNKGKLASTQRITINSEIDKIDGMVAWFETSLENSFNVSLDIQNGTNIAIWKDHNSSNIIRNNATQTTTNNQPKFISSVINNSIPALRFDGNDSLNFNATNLENSPYTIFIVEQRRTAASDNYLISTNSSGGTNLIFGYSSSTNLRYSHSGSNTDFTVENYDANQLTLKIHTLLFNNNDGTRYFLNKNNIADAVNLAQTTNISGITAGAIGKSLPNNSFYIGDIFEIIIFKRNLRDEERQKVANYLARKYTN